MNRTPEEFLVFLRERMGDEEAHRVWLMTNEFMSGHRLYWPVRIQKELTARAVYELRCQGRSVTAIMATLRMDRRTLYRLYSAELKRRRPAKRPEEAA